LELMKQDRVERWIRVLGIDVKGHFKKSCPA
jgi:hypothetical protein